jgi:hypothetical protein
LTTLQPLQCSNKLLKYLARIWEINNFKWNTIITAQHQNPNEAALHIQPTKVILAKLTNGDKPGPIIALRTSIDTLQAIFLISAYTKHRKLAKDTTPSSTLIHPSSWKTYINTMVIQTHSPTNYTTLKRRSNITSTTNKRPTPIDTYSPPITQLDTDDPLEALEVDSRKIQLHQTIYHVNRWNPL